MGENEARLIKENEELREQLELAKETLEAMRKGDVDAIIVDNPQGEHLLYSLVSPDHPYELFLENMGEAALIISEKGTILYANRSFFQMLGYHSEEVIGASVIDFIQDNQRSFFLKAIQKISKRKSEFCFIKKNEQVLTVAVSISTGMWQDRANICLLLNDITNFKRAQKLIEISKSTTKILGEAPNIGLAFKSLIELLKSYLGWEVMIVWAWNKETQSLTCVEMTHISDRACCATLSEVSK